MIRKLTLSLLLVVVGSLPAAADEIVYFANGTSMAVRSHTVDGDMIRVDLGAGAIMAFPVSMVERVMLGGRDVFTGPTYRPANQALPGEEKAAAEPVEVTQDTTVTGEGNLPARFRARPEAGRQRTGPSDSWNAAGPAADSGVPTRQGKLKRAGSRQWSLEQAPLGAEAVGDHFALSAKPPGAAPNKPLLTSVTVKGGVADNSKPPGETAEPPAETPQESQSEPPPESN